MEMEMEMEMRRRSVSGSCERHPQEEFTGSFCPSCLRDRLQGLDDSQIPYQTPRRSTSALPLRSLFPLRHSSAAPADPDLRRCKSFSARPASSLKPMPIPIPMKIHLDLDSQSRDSPAPKNANFWVRKWHQWRNKHRRPTTPMAPPHQNPVIRSDTQSELGGPRLSSFDCPPRFSLDEPPRGSWDGRSVSGRPVHNYNYNYNYNYSRFHHSVLSATEEDPAAIQRCDDQMPVVEDDVSAMPGSQAQTRDYYLDSSSRRRRSLDRSVSMRKPPPQLPVEPEKMQMGSIPAFNSKVSPAGGAEFYHYHHANANANSIAIANRDGIGGSMFGGPQETHEKKQKKWSLWGLIHRKGNGKGQSANGNGSRQPESSSLFQRSNSSASARSSLSVSVSVGGTSMRRNSSVSADINSNSKKPRDEFALERNRSARFYLTPTERNRTSGALPLRPMHQFY